MGGTATWRFEYLAKDGSIVIINVKASLNPDGSIKVDYALADDSADADLLRIGFDFFNDGGPLDKNPGQGQQSAIAPAGDGFDYIENLGTSGGNDPDVTSGSVTFTAQQLIDFGFVDKDANPLTGVDLMTAFSKTEIGFRATSVGDNREDSLKLVETGTFHPPKDDDPDFFPELSQGISHVMLVFGVKEGGGSDGYYTVKIDEFPGGEDQVFDLDNDIEAILAWLIECDPNITADTPLLGALIKSGNNVPTQFYAYGDNNLNGTDPDDLPEDWAVSANPRNANAAWRGEIEATYDFADIYAEDCDCIC
jgi:hypothetical protein